MARHIIVTAFILFSLTGCSTPGDLPSAPSLPETPYYNAAGAGSSGRYIMSIGIISIDPAAFEAEFIPDRNAAFHYDATPWLTPPYCNDCITIQVMEFQPAENYIKVKITLKNHSPFTAHDVRGIIISNYPNLRLINADSYTMLWDDGGPVFINPFKAYAKDWYRRRVPPYTSHEQEYEIHYPSMDALAGLNFVVDASWPGNCREPYKVGEAYTSGTFLDYEPQSIWCRVRAWDWDNEIASVTVDLSVIGWDKDTSMTSKGDNWWAVENIPWHSGGKGPGTYRALISAKTKGCPIFTFNYVDITIDASPPQTGWTITWGANGSAVASGVAADNGYIYVCGACSGIVDFDPGAGIDEQGSDDSEMAYLAKFNSAGEHQWARTWGVDSIAAHGVAVDDAGDVYCTGFFNGIDVDFDPGPGVDNHSSPAGLYNAGFLSKFNADGDFAWARTWGGTWDQYVFGIAVDSSGHIYVTGCFSGTGDFDPGTGVTEYTADGTRDAFLSKFDTDGDFLWARTWGGFSHGYMSEMDPGDRGYAVATDDSDNVYVTGVFDTEADFDPGAGVDIHTALGTKDSFLTTFDPEGDFRWARTWGYIEYLPASEGRYGVAVDKSGGVYVTGFGDSSPLRKFSIDGDFQWAKDWWRGTGIGVLTDDSGNAYVAGYFQYTDDFDPGAGTDYHSAVSGADIFLSKFSGSGDFQWARSWGNCSSFSTGIGKPSCGIAVDEDGNLYVCSGFFGTYDFNPGPGIDEHSSTGDASAFLSKLDPNGCW